MIENIPIFIKLVELHSYTEVAKHFQTTKSTVSRKINALELYFNKTLINRTSKKFSLTEDGQYIYNKFQLIPKLMDEAYNHLNQINQTISGTINAALPLIVSMELITPYLTHFKKTHPNITLNIVFSPSPPDMRNYDIALTPHIQDIDKTTYSVIFARSELDYT